ncbi:MAG: aspartyl protease family protein [Patescibacteria group bacterium]
MKFQYKKYGPRTLRPVIPVEVIHNGIGVPYEVLVDSGADNCIFDAQIGEILGVDIEKGEKAFVSGITGSPEPYYIHPVIIKVGGWEYKIKAGFKPNTSKLNYGVVGQNGFFDIFVIKFDLLKSEIELKSRWNKD